jgi:hypothetical protein
VSADGAALDGDMPGMAEIKPEGGGVVAAAGPGAL